jgi:hypothetical protein
MLLNTYANNVKEPQVEPVVAMRNYRCRHYRVSSDDHAGSGRLTRRPTFTYTSEPSNDLHVYLPHFAIGMKEKPLFNKQMYDTVIRQC